ncbi:hypothetical protein [Fodinibius sediminis]|uniref:Uncharacterized protein n=1 Tax=Fodinibius sediminis TaxID=1214077 RepID=A0A521CBR2_9BACT|nr:hypothetical protein [Fodinibius sediminis]SMO56838.1 hypothetical protein SAMN06265218_105237 [Fodinibius sediminis]
MSDIHLRLREYYVKGSYRGFYKVKEQRFRMAGITFVTFANGEKEIFATGPFREGALEAAFKQIDNYYAKQQYRSQAV